MNELIKVTEKNGQKAVSARELYQYLEITERFQNWCNRQFQYGFIEGVDYVGCKEFNTLANQELSDFALTIECAKEISMLQKSDKGKQARQYFIECEKRLVKPLNQLEFLQLQLNMLKEQSERIDRIEAKVDEIKSINAPIEHFSILGYCHNIGKQISHNEALSFGRKAAKICKELGLVIGKVSDQRYGAVNTYPLDVLSEIFNN